MRNAAAALVAIVCWAGLAIQFSVTLEETRHLLPALWTLARFFTILTNLLVALAMTWIAIGRRASPEVLGGMTLSIILVGVVYWALLEGLHQLSGGAQLADFLLHKLSPVLMTLWWLLFAPRARLRWNAPAWWALYPLIYFVYVLVRAHFDGRYPYPFLDVGHIGWLQTMLNAGGIALAFIIAGLALVWIDRWRPLGSKRAYG
jgi:hypothetical protein